MSRTRQPARADPSIVRGLAVGYPQGHRIEVHAHDWSQLVLATRGAMEVRTERRRWVVPPGRALWMPAGIEHSLRCLARVDLRSIYLPGGASGVFGSRVGVLDVPALLRELVVHVVAIGPLLADEPAHVRLRDVLVDLVEPLRPLALELPWPADQRAARVAEALWRRPSDEATIDDLATYAGTSVRTLERTFLRETSLTLDRWRRQARIVAAVRLLSEGERVADVALAVGYRSPSAFVAMFRRALGETPGRMFDVTS